MYGDWIIAKGTEIGLRHIENGSNCQDSHGLFYNQGENYGIAIVSDGAGSALNSELGSKFLVEKGLVLINEFINESSVAEILKSDPVTLNDSFIKCFKKLYEELNVYSGLHSLLVKSLASTVIVVIFSHDGLVCSHIGDGRAGYQDHHGEWFSVLDPFKGQEENQTVFITSDIWGTPENFVRTQIVNQPIQSFAVLSDGCEGACFELNRFNHELLVYERMNNPYPRFFNPNIQVLRTLFDEGKSNSDIDALWSLFLKSGNEKLRDEYDDKTLILGTLVIQAADGQEL